MSEFGEYVPFKGRVRGWEAERAKVLAQAIAHDSAGKWVDYDSPIDSLLSFRPGENHRSFGAFFQPLLTGSPSLKFYIKKRLAQKSGQAIGIEFGGPGSSLFASLVPVFKKSLGVVLLDLRDKFDQSGNSKREDRRRNHWIIEGDMLQAGTLEKVTGWLKGERADFIIERLSGPIGVLSSNPFYLARKLNHIYQILAEGGVMFLQCPSLPYELMEAWRNKVLSMVESGFLEVAIASQKPDSMLRIEKNSNAPPNLPFLSARETLTFYRHP